MKSQPRLDLKTEKDGILITIKIANKRHKIDIKRIQFGVYLNKVTTRHKLQGGFFDTKVVRSWSYSF